MFKKECGFAFICLKILIIVSDDYIDNSSPFSIDYLISCFEGWSIVLLFFNCSATLDIKIFFFIFEIKLMFQFGYYLVNWLWPLK